MMTDGRVTAVSGDGAIFFSGAIFNYGGKHTLVIQNAKDLSLRKFSKVQISRVWHKSMTTEISYGLSRF